MLALARLKSEAAFWQINTIRLERPYLVLEYKDLGRAKQLVRQSGGRLRIVDDRCLYMNLPSGPLSADALVQLARDVLRPPEPPVKPKSVL
jgi:hypothetical protein